MVLGQSLESRWSNSVWHHAVANKPTVLSRGVGAVKQLAEWWHCGRITLCASTGVVLLTDLGMTAAH